MDEFSRLVATIRPLLDARIQMDGGAISDDHHPFNDTEWQQVARANHKRQREFVCGRHHAHRLLDTLGFADSIIGRDDRGCPLWPAGIVGSISHTSDFCIAMLARAEQFQSVGVDLEESGRLKPSLWPRLFSQAEIADLGSIADPLEQIRRAAIMFSAKEAFYKCDYPVNQRSYDFMDLRVSIDQQSRRLTLHLDGSEQQLQHHAVYASGMTHVVTAVYLDGRS